MVCLTPAELESQVGDYLNGGFISTDTKYSHISTSYYPGYRTEKMTWTVTSQNFSKGKQDYAEFVEKIRKQINSEEFKQKFPNVDESWLEYDQSDKRPAGNKPGFNGENHTYKFWLKVRVPQNFTNNYKMKHIEEQQNQLDHLKSTAKTLSWIKEEMEAKPGDQLSLDFSDPERKLKQAFLYRDLDFGYALDAYENGISPEKILDDYRWKRNPDGTWIYYGNEIEDKEEEQTEFFMPNSSPVSASSYSTLSQADIDAMLSAMKRQMESIQTSMSQQMSSINQQMSQAMFDPTAFSPYRKRSTVNKIDELKDITNEENYRNLIEGHIEQRKRLLKEVTKKYNAAIKLKEKSSGSKSYLEVISKYGKMKAELKSEIRSLEENNEKTLKKSLQYYINKELENLENIVGVGDDKKIPDLDDITTELVEDRINTYSLLLTGKGLNGKESNTIWDTDDFLYTNLQLANRIDRIRTTYLKKQIEVIKSFVTYIANNDSDITNKEGYINAAMNEIQEGRNPFSDTKLGGLVDKMFADFEQGFGINGTLIKRYMRIESMRVASQIKPQINAIGNLVKEAEKEDKDFDIDYLLRKDENGEKTTQLLNGYTRGWGSTLNKLKKLRSEYENMNRGKSVLNSRKAYSDYVNYLEDNVDIIDPLSIPGIVDLIKYYDEQHGTNFYERLGSPQQKNIDLPQTYKENLVGNEGNYTHYNAEIVEKQKALLFEYFDEVSAQEATDNVIIDINNDKRNPIVFRQKFIERKLLNNFNNTKSEPKISSYCVFVPKNKEDYDSSFKDKMVGKKAELWSLIRNLVVDQINPLLIEHGHNVGLYDLPFSFSTVESEFFKNLGFIKRFRLKIANWFDKRWVNFFNSRAYNNSKEPKEGRKSVKGISVGEANILIANEMRNLKEHSVKTLEEMCKELKIPHKDFDQFLNTLKNRDSMKSTATNWLYKDYLADLIARKKIMPYTNKNFLANLNDMALALTLMVERDNSKAFVETVYNNTYRITKEKNISAGREEAPEWVTKQFRTAIDRNVYGDTVAGDRGQGKNGNIRFSHEMKSLAFQKDKKFITTKVKKRYTYGEDLTMDLLEERKKNIPKTFLSYESGKKYDKVIEIRLAGAHPLSQTEQEFNEDYPEVNLDDIKETTEFTTGNNSYKVIVDYQIDGKSFDDMTEEEQKEILNSVNANTMAEAYEKIYYKTIDEQKEEYGAARTIGGIWTGLLSLNTVKELGLNPESGWRNREEGKFKNEIFAASGRYGFNTKDLYSARRFLFGVNVMKRLKVGNRGKVAQVHIFENISKGFSMFQNHTNTGIEEGGWFKKAFGLFNFAIDMPETHNQGEIVMAMIHHKSPILKTIPDDNGVVHEVPMFDTGKNKFMVFDEEAAMRGIHRLKPEFRTPENISKWEKFEVDDKDHENLNFISKIQSSITRIQGNYEDTDVMQIQANLYGKTAIRYKRWAGSHYRQKYQNQRVDLLTGKLDQEGMMDVLYRHKSVFITFMAINTILGANSKLLKALISAGTLNFRKAGSVFFSMIADIVVQCGTVSAFVHKQMDVDIKNRNEENHLCAKFILDFLKRSFFTTLKEATLNTVNVGGTVGENTYKNLDENEKMGLKEASQQMANNISIIIKYRALGCLIVLLEALINPRDCDTDDCDERFEWAQKTMNFLMNCQHMLVTDALKWTNILTWWNDMGSVSIIETTKRMLKLSEKLSEDDLSVMDKIVLTAKRTPQPFLPNSILNPLLTIPANLIRQDEFTRNLELPFQDTRVYDSFATDWFWKTNTQRKEMVYKDYTSTLNSYADQYVRRQLIEIKKQYGPLTPSQEKALKTKLKDSFKKPYQKPKDISKSDFVEYVDLDKLLKNAEEASKK